MKHLEKNTTPFGLLSKEEQDYLRTQAKQGKQLLVWGTIKPDKWVYVDDDLFYPTDVYRTIAEPERVVMWLNIYPTSTILFHKSRGAADEAALSNRICVFRIEWDKKDGGNYVMVREEV